ncbi:MAG: hybrid sensor histidine kinase/response regulator [Bdellovibrio sp. CG10_big_fil_rev_8_21_14_0_10_47_8]|nr:MAG: hybrid sensor histidine kinase/response regulator [Bdellovibrio sp. CG10_big_fil_rev_8_21_14_0_10_47_8]
MKQTILCVDDEIDNVQALERLFRHKYTVLKSTSGKQALEILDHHPDPIALIITDQRMPEMTGVELLAATVLKRPETVRILLTGYTDIESVISAVNNGQIYRYLTKPWDPVDLQNTVDHAVEKFLLFEELKEKNKSLEIAHRDLQSLDQAKNQFMILINHELKTPLTSILSFSELMKETRLTEEQETCLSRIYKSSLRLKSLIDDVLLVVGSETNTLKANMIPVDLQSLDPRLPIEVEQVIKVKDQKLTRQLLDQRVVADPGLLSLVLQKLIHNAAKFGINNSEILLSSALLAPHRIKILVHNQGSSISPQVINKILRPFYIDEDVMNHSVGMGLGLTVCQSILKAHGSSLQIENVSGGVQVSFELSCL